MSQAAKTRPPRVLDVDFINPFLAATVQTLETQCMVKVTAGRPFIKQRGIGLNFDIAGVIGLTAKPYSGSIAVCFVEGVFLPLMGRMIGETFTEITEGLEDGAGELLNMIAGAATRTLSDNGIEIERALPTIVRGKEIMLAHMAFTPTLILPFACDEGQFYVEVTMQNEEGDAKAKPHKEGE